MYAAFHRFMDSRNIFRTRLIAVFGVALLVTVALQWRSNAYGAEWRTGDESAHYVTGLLVRDYIAQGMPEAPMTYALRYYDHYPRVALGHWPPVFYIIQAAWTLPFGTSRTSLLLLMAVINAALLTTTYAVAARYFPSWLCWGLMIFLCSLPAVQDMSRRLMSETLVALLVLWSFLAFHRYMESRQWQPAVGFGVLAATAILTKGTGIALAPIPALAALLPRHRNPARSPLFWAPALIVAVICVPWFGFVPGALHERVARFGGVSFRIFPFFESLSYLRQQFLLAG